MNFRIGIGFDVHKLQKGKDLYLGGAKITHTKGAVAHSDGDTLIHAICDALLGAANLRDIGFHFPDTNKKYKNIDSKILLKKVVDLLKKNKYKIINIDSTICLQKPKISKYIPSMKQTLAKVIGIASEKISVKATTTENLGFIGRQEGVACFAVVLIEINE